MRRVIRNDFKTVRIIETRREASLDTEDSLAVKQVYPRAHIKAQGTLKFVSRPKEPGDAPSLLPYRILSGEHYTANAAWKDARQRLSL